MRSRIALLCPLVLMLLLLSQTIMAASLSFEAESDASQDKNIGGLGPSPPLTPQSSTTLDWHIECVDCPKQFLGPDHSLRLDGDGHPHVAYGGDHLYYAWYDGTSWRYETVDNASKVGASASLALDADGNPHISYFDQGNGIFKYAHRLNGEWEIETVDRAANGSGSLVLDAAGQPHVSYYSNDEDPSPSGLTTYTVKYAFWTGSSWDFQTLEQGTAASNHLVWGISLALDSSGHPHVGYALNYVLPCESCIKYARWTSGAWDTQIVEQKDSVIPTRFYSPKLVLDTADVPHILYGRTLGSVIYTSYILYASRADSTWDVQTIASGRVGGASLALDPDDRPHISYDHDGALKYTYWTGSDWNLRPVDNESGGSVSLALDAGDPHLVYYASDALKYAYWAGASWTVQALDKEGKAGWYNALALDTTGRPHISYYDATDGTLKVARWISDTWRIEVVDTTGDAGSYTSIVLDANDHPCISYFSKIDGYRHLKYAHWTGSVWDVQTVDSGGDDSGNTSLALDSNGHPHISYDYSETSPRALKYARWTGSAWDIQTVDNSTSSVGLYNALALDTADHPHISYFDYDAYTLKYAHWTGSAWDIQTVDSGGDVGRYTSLALDAADFPHISYQAAYPNWDLRYAYWTGSTWHIQTVDSEDYAGMFTSLALDVAGSPHISYASAEMAFDSPAVLKYAHWTGNTWDIQTVTSVADANVEYTDLALDAGGRPRISYHDGYPNYDLKYARLPLSLALDKRATPSDGLQLGDVVTYTLTVSAPHLSVQLWDPIPENVDYVPGSVTPPTAVYSPTAEAISWQGVVPDSGQIVRFQVTARGTMGTGTLLLPIVNTAWLTDMVYGTSVSSTVIVNGRYGYLPLVMR